MTENKSNNQPPSTLSKVASAVGKAVVPVAIAVKIAHTVYKVNSSDPNYKPPFKK